MCASGFKFRLGGLAESTFAHCATSPARGAFKHFYIGLFKGCLLTPTLSDRNSGHATSLGCGHQGKTELTLCHLQAVHEH